MTTDIKVIRREPTEEQKKAYYVGGTMKCTVCGKEFDAAPSLNPWVSVKVRLPTKEEAAADSAGLLFTGKNIGFFHGSYDEQGEVFTWDMYTYGLDEVSHFMPIPRPDAAPVINPWVSVKIDAPKKNDWYLCRHVHPTTGVVGYGDFEFSDSHFVLGGRVSHWWDESIMPIPKPEDE